MRTSLLGSRSILNTLAILLLFLGATFVYRLRLDSTPALAPHTAHTGIHRPTYPPGVPDKFLLNGTVLPIPGNTIICPIPPNSPLRPTLLNLYERLRTHPLAHLYALLPPGSWHMTVFEGVVGPTHRERIPGQTWPQEVPVNASIETCTDFFAERLEGLYANIPAPYHANATGMGDFAEGGGISLQIRPLPADEKEFRELRDLYAKRLGIRAKDHETYRFHVSFAYLLQWLSEEQDRQLRAVVEEYFGPVLTEFELSPPVLCRFDNTSAYMSVKVLESATPGWQWGWIDRLGEPES